MTAGTYLCPDERCDTEQFVAASAVATIVFTEQGRQHCRVVCLCPDCGARVHLNIEYPTVRAIERFLMVLPRLDQEPCEDHVDWETVGTQFREIVAKEFWW